MTASEISYALHSMRLGETRIINGKAVKRKQPATWIVDGIECVGLNEALAAIAAAT